MARRSSEEKRAFWRMVVQMQEESGLSVRRFCEQEGLGQASFFGWRRKFRAEGAERRDGSEHGGESVRLPVRLDVQDVVAGLDERCQTVCELLSQGLSRSQIAEQMQCGWHTVDRLVRTIRERLEEAEVDGWLQ